MSLLWTEVLVPVHTLTFAVSNKVLLVFELILQALSVLAAALRFTVHLARFYRPAFIILKEFFVCFYKITINDMMNKFVSYNTTILSETSR